MDMTMPPNPAAAPSPIEEESNFIPVTQPWVHQLPLMQQGVLLAAVRGPDGISKNHVSKLLLRWFRRSIIMCAFDHRSFTRPYDFMARRGGGFTGPSLGPPSPSPAHAHLCRNPLVNVGEIYSIDADPFSRRQRDLDVIDRWEMLWPKDMHDLLHHYLLSLDELPHHFQTHFMHGAEILGYKHHLPEVRQWWHECYLRLVEDMHLCIESEDAMNARLSDNEEQWRSFGGVRAL